MRLFKGGIPQQMNDDSFLIHCEDCGTEINFRPPMISYCGKCLKERKFVTPYDISVFKHVLLQMVTNEVIDKELQKDLIEKIKFFECKI